MTPTWSPCPRLPVLSVQGTVRYGPPARLWCLEAQCPHNRSRGLGSLTPLNQAPLPPKVVPGGSVNRGETGARTPKAIFSGRILGPGVGREGSPSTSLPHSHPTSRGALRLLLSLEGPMGLSVWPNCVSASRHLPSRRSPGSESKGLPSLRTSIGVREQRSAVREQRSAFPMHQHRWPLPTLQASLRVIAPSDKPSQKTHPAHGSTPAPLPFGLARWPDSPCVTGQPFVRTPGTPSPLGQVNLCRDDSSFHLPAFHGSHPPRLKHSCSPSQPSLSLEPKLCTNPAPPGEDPPPPSAPALPRSRVSTRSTCSTHSVLYILCVCLLGALSTHPDPGPDSTWTRPSRHWPAWLKGCPRGRGCPKCLSSTPVSPHPRPC